MNLLNYIREYLNKWFNFPGGLLYCQVATLGNKGPTVRTMDFYHLTDAGNVILLTSTESRKWEDLQSCSRMSLCLAKPTLGQIIIEGRANLKTIANDAHTTQFYWNNYLDAYWRNFYLSRNKPLIQNIPLSFGVINLEVDCWEILEINQTDYFKSIRKQYHKVESNWVEKELEPL